MKATAAIAALILSASAAMAEAPCENPVVPACQQACAAMGAKLILAMRWQGVQPVSARDAAAAGSTDSAEKLALLSGLSLDYINGMPLLRLREAIGASCSR